MCVPLGVERKALRLPSPTASSTTAAGISEEEGLHTCPLPHNLSGNLGGGRIGTSPFLLTLPVCTSEEEGQALLLTLTTSTSEEEGQVGVLLVPLTVEINEFVYVHT